MKVDSRILYIEKTLNRFKITDNKGTKLSEDGLQSEALEEALNKFCSLFSLENKECDIDFIIEVMKEIEEMPCLSAGSEGFPVKYLQWRIDETRNGVYDTRMKALVIKFQSKNKLATNGIFDKSCWEKLIN